MQEIDSSLTINDSITNRIEFVEDTLFQLKKKNIINPIISFKDLLVYKQTNPKVDNLISVMNNMNATLQYINCNDTGNRFTFEAQSYDLSNSVINKYEINVIARFVNFEIHNSDDKYPEDKELSIVKLLSNLIKKKQTPHLILPIGTFDIWTKEFVNYIQALDHTDTKYQKFINEYNDGKYQDKMYVVISEWANRSDLNDYISKNYKKFLPIHWKVIFFQIISTIAIIQSNFPSFRHNNLTANNIQIAKNTRSVVNYKYKVKSNKYIVPNIGYQIRICCFDFTTIPNIIELSQDIHHFFYTFIKQDYYLKMVEKNLIPKEMNEFITYVLPLKYRSDSYVSPCGKLLHNVELLNPLDILQHPYFDKFRKTTKNNSNTNNVISNPNLNEKKI